MSYLKKTKNNDTIFHQYSCSHVCKKTQKLQQKMHCCKINKKQKKQGAKKTTRSYVVRGKVVVAPCHQM
jgi:hypothetical protein